MVLAQLFRAVEEAWEAVNMVDSDEVVLAYIINNKCNNLMEWKWWEWEEQEAAISSTEVAVVVQWVGANNTELQTTKDLRQGTFPTKPAGVSNQFFKN